MIIKKLSIVIITLMISVLLSAEQNSETIKKSFETTENSKLIFTDIDGNVTVEKSNSKNIKFVFTKEISSKDASKRDRYKYFSEIKPVYEVEDGIVKIKIRYPKKRSGIFSSFFGAKVKINTRLSVPEGIVVKIKTVDGNINGKGLKNRMALRTVDGNITVVASTGTLNSVSTDGNCTVENFNGPVSHTSVDGNIRVSGMLKKVSLITVDGNISAEFAAGSTLSGDSRMKSVDGSLRVIIPGAFPVKVMASSVDGSIRIDESAFDSLEKRSSRRVRASNENAEFEISLRTVDGSIRLSKK